MLPCPGQMLPGYEITSTSIHGSREEEFRRGVTGMLCLVSAGTLRQGRIFMCKPFSYPCNHEMKAGEMASAPEMAADGLDAWHPGEAPPRGSMHTALSPPSSPGCASAEDKPVPRGAVQKRGPRSRQPGYLSCCAAVTADVLRTWSHLLFLLTLAHQTWGW